MPPVIRSFLPIVNINAGDSLPPQPVVLLSPFDLTWAYFKSMAQVSTEIGLGNLAKTHAHILFHSSPDVWHEEYAHGIPHGFPRPGQSIFPGCSPLSISFRTRSNGRDISATPTSKLLLCIHSDIVAWLGGISLGIPPLPLVQ